MREGPVFALLAATLREDLRNGGFTVHNEDATVYDEAARLLRASDVVRHVRRRHRPAMPCWRIRRRTFFLLMTSPALRSALYMRGTP